MANDINNIKRISGGRYVAEIDYDITFTGKGFSISDKPNLPVGDACAALHEELLIALGPGVEVTEARSTKDYFDSPADSVKAINQHDNTFEVKR